MKEPGSYSALLLTRVRLTRNIKDIPFSWKAGACDKRRVAAVIRPVLRKVAGGRALMLDGRARAAFVRRSFPSVRALRLSGVEVWLLGGPDTAAVVNYVDHLCIQSCRPGLATGRLLREAERLGGKIDALLPVARSREWGRLTASPADAGLGIGVSYLADLSALERTGTLGFALNRLRTAGMVCRRHSTGGRGRLWHLTTARPYGLGARPNLFQAEKALAQILTIERAAADLPAIKGLI